MDNKSREAEIKRIQDMISRLEDEQDFIASYEQAVDLSSMMYEEDLDTVLFEEIAESPASPAVKSVTPVSKTVSRLGTEPALAPAPVAETQAQTAVQAPAVETAVPVAPATVPVVEAPVQPVAQAPVAETPVQPVAPAPVVETAAPVVPAPTQPVTPAPTVEIPVQQVAPTTVVQTPVQPVTPAPAPAPVQPTVQTPVVETPVQQVAPVMEAPPVEPVIIPDPVPTFDYAANAAPAPAPVVETAVPVVETPAPAPLVETPVQPVAPTPAPAVEPAAPASAPVVEEAPIKKKRKSRFSKRAIVIMVLVECLVLAGAVFLFTHRDIFSKSKNDVVYSDPDQVDEITCADGTLNVNNVSVSVPEENATYNISYTWGKKDEDYPTVPHSVTSSYYDKDGKLLYDISLYRDSLTKPSDIPEGKDASNWFSDWSTDDSEANLHTPKDSGKLHGFLVSTIENTGEDSSGVTYGSTTYYFAIQDKEGLSLYVLEGILYDKASLETYRKVMDDCINSIKVSKK